MNNIVILDHEIQQAKRLNIEDEEGDMLFGDVLMIDASGLLNSNRKMRDGYTFFGTVEVYVHHIILYYIILFLEKSANE
jgi:hypothetical protein